MYQLYNQMVEKTSVTALKTTVAVAPYYWAVASVTRGSTVQIQSLSSCFINCTEYAKIKTKEGWKDPITKNSSICKLDHFRHLFIYFYLYPSLFSTVDSKYNCQWLDSNRRSLVAEATTLPTCHNHCPKPLILAIRIESLLQQTLVLSYNENNALAWSFYARVAILVSEILDLVSPKDFGMT